MANRIESYDFGRIKISGETYTSDVIIFPERIEASWWRQEGHILTIDDLSPVFEEKPEVLVIGTGFGGVMKVPDAVLKALRDMGIDTVVTKTQEACEEFNNLMEKEQVVAALHLTC